MTITLKIDEFLYELFPGTENDTEKLINTISRFYVVGPFEPTVTVEEDSIHIEIDVDRIQADKQKFDKLVSLAERGEFDQAKDYAAELIEVAPHISEYHRILGQIYSETGEQDEAINTLIDALKWNPKNENALLMVGNIYANYKDDADTALDYYEQVLALNPDDHLALNNIGVKLMEAGKLKQAKQYLELAEEIEPEYPNTLHALAMLHEMQDELQEAFSYAIESLKRQNKTNTPLYKKSVGFLFDVAGRLTSHIDSKSVVNSFVSELEVKTGTDIRVKEDSELNTAAKIEYAEVHGRDYHLVLYKPKHPGVDHLILHELTHLELAHEAREQGKQQMFTSNASNKSAFMRKYDKDARKLKKQGIPEAKVNNLMQMFFSGLNGQIFNAPIDLFIEDRIYNRFEKIRPLQLMSMFTIMKQGIEANTRSDVIKITPSTVLSASVTYNLVSAMHFRDLFGVDLIAEHKPKKSEVEKASEFYQEFQEYRQDKEPGEEYNLVQFWAEDLKVDRYFELIEEDKQSKSAESVLDDIENDPYGLDIEDPVAERKMKQFMEHHGDADVNQAVAMYMVSALQYFKDMPKEEVKKIAMDIATVGMTGIDPEKDGYHIPSIEGSSFSGYKTLAYYYVSWAIAIPEMLDQLEMPFDREYELARKLVKK